MGLTISRKPGESFKIGDTIVVKVVSFKGNQIRLGIEAPREVPIRRVDHQPRKAG